MFLTNNKHFTRETLESLLSIMEQESTMVVFDLHLLIVKKRYFVVINRKGHHLRLAIKLNITYLFDYKPSDFCTN